MPTASSPCSIAERATARIAAFKPGAVASRCQHADLHPGRVYDRGPCAAPSPSRSPSRRSSLVGRVRGRRGCRTGRPSRPTSSRPLCAGAKRELAREPEAAPARSASASSACRARGAAASAEPRRRSAPTPAAPPRTRPRSPTSRHPTAPPASPPRSSNAADIASIYSQLRRIRDGASAQSDPAGRRLGSSAGSRSSTPCNGLEQVVQRLVQIGMPELVPEVQRPPRNHPLSAPQHLRRTRCRTSGRGRSRGRGGPRGGRGRGPAPSTARRW